MSSPAEVTIVTVNPEPQILSETIVFAEENEARDFVFELPENVPYNVTSGILYA